MEQYIASDQRQPCESSSECSGLITMSVGVEPPGHLRGIGE